MRLKTCSVCKIEKSLDSFYRQKTGKFGRLSMCKVCNRLQGKKYYALHQNQRKNYFRQYRKEHPDKTSKAQKKYYNNHKEESLVRYKRWAKNNPDKIRGYGEKRTSKLNEFPEMGFIDIKLIDNYYTKVCGICGLKIESKYEIDHIIPLSRNGVHLLQNLQLTHPLCNRTKHNRLQKDMQLDIVMLRELITD
jgi:5-methylcytosine-specific restriction endonuclease McrA